MIVKNNIFLKGVSGKAQNMVVKQYADKTVITTVPDMSNRILSEKQKASNELMRFAISCAKEMVADPRKKERACELLGVPPNKVFRAIVKHYMLTNADLPALEETEQEKKDKQTLSNLKTIIVNEIADAEIILFGSRAGGSYDAGSDWDLLILANDEFPKALKWELQEKLFDVTIKQGTRVNMLLVQKNKWHTEQEYELLRKKIAENSIVVS